MYEVYTNQKWPVVLGLEVYMGNVHSFNRAIMSHILCILVDEMSLTLLALQWTQHITHKQNTQQLSINL